MDKTLIYGLFETLRVSAAGQYPEVIFSKNRYFLKKIKKLTLKKTSKK
jgi:hypothetical protein